MRRAPGLVALALTAVLLAGCTGGDADDRPDPSAASGVELVTAGDGGGVVEATVPGAHLYRGEVRIAVQSLTVDGPLMELRLAYTPLGGPGLDPEEPVSMYDMRDLAPLVNDVTTLRQYEVFGDWETDVVHAETVEGRPLLYRAWYPAPEQRVEVLDVVVGDAGPTFRDVPVTYR